jgi:uncharacterized membrane protein YkoI
MKHMFAGLAILAAVAGGAPAVARPATATPHSLKGGKLAPLAHVKLAAARATALKARPGKITDQELEKEAGGTGLRYSFDIESGGKTYEVGIDAKTGRVLENAVEGKNPD